MKLAPWMGLAAIAALLGVVAWADAPCDCTDNNVATPLDFRGIDTLELEADSANVRLVSEGTPPRLRQPRDVQSRVERIGGTLRIQQGDEDSTLTIDAPSTLRRVVLSEGGHLDAEKVPVAALDVEARGHLYWKGDAGSLRILHRGPRADCDESEYNCDADVTIWSGKIDALEVRLPSGGLTLHNASDVSRLVLGLGPDVDYHFLNMDGPAPQVELLPAGAAEEEPDGAQASVLPVIPGGVPDALPVPGPDRAASVPAEPAPEPPRPR